MDKDIFLARDLLVIFLKQALSVLGRSITSLPIKKIVITTENVNLNTVETFSVVLNKLGIDSRKLIVIDYRESFYYYVLNQPPEIFLHDVYIFDYTYRQMKFYRFKRNLNVKPQVINISEGSYDLFSDNPDEAFCDIIDKSFAGKVVSCVYLIGEGFEGEWMVDKLSSYASRITRKNTNMETSLPLTISAAEGLIAQTAFFNNVVASTNMSGYYLLKKGEFAYNKSYSNGYPFGAVKKLEKYEQDGLVFIS